MLTAQRRATGADLGSPRRRDVEAAVVQKRVHVAQTLACPDRDRTAVGTDRGGVDTAEIHRDAVFYVGHPRYRPVAAAAYRELASAADEHLECR